MSSSAVCGAGDLPYAHRTLHADHVRSAPTHETVEFELRRGTAARS